MTARAILALLAFLAFTFAFYHLLALPLILEYSFLGIAAAGSLAAALLFSLPRGRRAEPAALALAFLYALAAARRLEPEGVGLRALALAALLVAYPALAWLAARVPWRRTALAVAVAAAMGTGFPTDLAPALTGFYPKWVSPRLADEPRLPFLAHALADLDGDGTAEIAVAGTAPARAGSPRGPLTGRRFAYRAFRWDGRGFRPVDLDGEARRRLAAVLPHDSPATPPLALAWERGADGAPAFGFALPADPFALAGAAAAPGYLPGTLLALALRDVDESLASRRAALGENGASAPSGPAPVRAPGRRDLALVAAEADVDGDGRPERLIDYPDGGAAILAADGRLLWQAPNSSFRFEAVGPLGAGRQPEIIAGDKGFIGFDPRRYLGGYRLAEDGRLVREWKVFVPGVVNPALGDVDGDGQNELVFNLYGTHRLVVLERHGLPVAGAAYAATFLVVGWNLRRGGRRNALGPAAAAAFLALVLAGGPAATPARSLAAGAGPRQPDAGAEPFPDAARLLGEAVRRTAEVTSFQYEGQTVTYLGKRRNQVDYAGIVAPGEMRGLTSLWGETYDLYRRGDRVYLYDRRERRWAGRALAGFAPPASLGETLAALPAMSEGARILPRPEIVARTPSRVLVLHPTAEQVAALLPPGLAPAAGPLPDALRQGSYRLMVWVGERDGRLRQIQLLASLPVPGAGVLLQKTLIKFWGFDEAAAALQRPDPARLPAVDAYPPVPALPSPPPPALP